MKEVKLIDLIDEISMGPFGSNIKVDNFIESGIPVLNGSNLTDHKLVENSFKYISTEKANSLGKANAKRGDIVITHRGTLGQVSHIPNNSKFERYVISQSQFRVRFNEKVDPVYFSYLMKSDYGQGKLLSFKNHVGVPALAQATTNFKSLEMLIHDISDQQKIASILSALDDKIELNNRINSELEAMAKLLYEYWFVQFDFPYDLRQSKPADETSKPQDIKPYKSSGGKMIWNKDLNREIPEGWGSGVASNLFDFNPSLGIPKGAGAKYLDMHSIPQSGFMTLEPQIKEFAGGVKFQNGDVVVARITPCLENGKTALITQLEENEIGFGSTEFIVIRGKSSQLSGFASFLARSESFRNFAISNMTGTSGRKRVDANTLKNYSLPIPDDMILSKFEGITAEIFNTQTNNVKQNQELSSLRDWLLPMLMNGQISVMDAEERVSEELGMVAEGERGRYEKK
jgi:type I restriction enzyme S subunit